MLAKAIGDLNHLAEFYYQQFITMIAVQLQYRVAMIIWLIGIVVEPVVYLVVWTTVANASGGSVNGFTPTDFAAYFIASMIANHLTFTWHMWEYDYRIREGLLSPVLLRPFHPIHADIAENFSYKVITLLVIIPTAVGLGLLFKPAFHPPAWSAVMVFPAIVLAFFVQFLLGWALAMAAFWTTRIMAINRIYFLGKLFLAGQLAPLALLPYPLQVASSILPFRWMLSFPVELALGRLSFNQAWWGLLAQVIWSLLAVLSVRLIWKAGVRRYSAFGA